MYRLLVLCDESVVVVFGVAGDLCSNVASVSCLLIVVLVSSFFVVVAAVEDERGRRRCFTMYVLGSFFMYCWAEWFFLFHPFYLVLALLQEIPGTAMEEQKERLGTSTDLNVRQAPLRGDPLTTSGSLPVSEAVRTSHGPGSAHTLRTTHTARPLQRTRGLNDARHTPRKLCGGSSVSDAPAKTEWAQFKGLVGPSCRRGGRA